MLGGVEFERLSQDTITLIRRIDEQIKEIYNNYIVLYQQDVTYQSSLYLYVKGKGEWRPLVKRAN